MLKISGNDISLSNDYNDMLKEYLHLNTKEDDDNNQTSQERVSKMMNELYEDSLNDIQKKAFNMFKVGKNISIIGFSGTGKSLLTKTINTYIKSETSKRIYLCSTTGISAYNIGGMTINAFMGIGTGDSDLNVLIKKVYRNRSICDRIYYTDILVIDEISMMSAVLFEKIDLICQRIKRNKKFFGGIQLVITGDFLQLLPVFNNMNSAIYKNKSDDVDERLIIESDVFLDNFTDKNTIFLNENMRQKGDKKFMELLLNVRYNKMTEEDLKLLKSRLITTVGLPKESATVTLVSTNKHAQMINEKNLNDIKEKAYYFDADFETSGDSVEMKKLLETELKTQFTQKGITRVILKKGAHVMLIKNLDVDLGLVNGSLGKVVNFVGGLPEIEFNNKIKRVIGYTQFELEMENCKVIAKQIPILVSYAITIHKSQSITLNSAILDIGGCWCDHQVYVALSRVTSLEGLYLKTFNDKKIKVNKKMLDYLKRMNYM